MIRSIVLISLLILFSNGIASAADTPIDLTKVTPSPSPRIPVSGLPVSATISETVLSVYFDSPVANAIITVYDANDNVVYQETVDTYSTSEVFIPAYAWASGNYTLTITYDTTTLMGDFQLE